MSRTSAISVPQREDAEEAEHNDEDVTLAAGTPTSTAQTDVVARGFKTEFAINARLSLMISDDVSSGVEKFADAVAYVLCSVGPSTRTKIVKLLFLADRYHIAMHGIPILQDPHDRTHGLLFSHAMELLERTTDLTAVSAGDAADVGLETLLGRLAIDNPASEHARYSAKAPLTTGSLSPSETEALDAVIREFDHHVE